MAEEVLFSIMTDNPIQHLPQHDLESFVWVLCYCIGRQHVVKRGSLTKEEHRKFCLLFHGFFGRMKIATIHGQRTSQSGPIRMPELMGAAAYKIFSDEMQELFKQLRIMLHAAVLTPEEFTHDSVLALLDDVIEKLRNKREEEGSDHQA